MMKRKILIGLLLCCLLIGIVPISVFAQHATDIACPHHPEHTMECGYVEEEGEDSCQFACPICTLQKRIDALPEVEEVVSMDDAQKEEVRAEVEAIHNVMSSFIEEQIIELDKTRLEVLEEALKETEQDGEEKKEEAILVEDRKFSLKQENTSKLKGDYTIDTVSPSHVQMNVFDYWIHERDTVDCGGPHPEEEVPGANTNHVAKWQPRAFVGGINDGHPLMFCAGGIFIGDDSDIDARFNGWTRAEGMAYRKTDGSGIVKNELENGYPVLNFTEDEVQRAFQNTLDSGVITNDPTSKHNESLQYLFDPQVQVEGKTSFKNVTGLFKIHENGNYYYNSKENFAELVETENRFKVYNAPAVKYDAIEGQFFPFNSGDEVFKENGDGTISGNGIRGDDEKINHYFGLTMSVDFQQPAGGFVSNGAKKEPMKFTFAGDDDVLIFIDGVLVADLGGIHDPLWTEIDFETGNITIRREDNKTGTTVINTTLKDEFSKAGKDTSSFVGNTFADHSVHTLDMFYLERGNSASNLELSFNLMEANYGEIHKVDENGTPLKDVVFDLYHADDTFTVESNATPLARLKTDENGRAELSTMDEQGKKQPIILDDNEHYVLREIIPNPGYISTGDIHLTYNANTQIFDVENMWETGVAGRFKANVLQAGELKDGAGNIVNTQTAKDGLILAVPFFNKTNKGNHAKDGWKPLHGSALGGYNVIDMQGQNSSEAYQKAVLEASLRQMMEENQGSWYVDYNEELQRFEGMLHNLPGTADRYVFVNESDGDMLVGYYLLENNGIFASSSSAEEKIAQLEASINKGDVEANIKSFVNTYYKDMKLLDINDFNRIFYTELYVPNTLRDLWVSKVDEEGNVLAGAEFTLFEDKECTKPVAKGITNEAGALSFSGKNKGNNAVNGGNLSSEVYFPLQRVRENGKIYNKSYWLKETKAPIGYKCNDSVIEVLITEDSIYANAGVKEDGVSVVKGMGRLVDTMSGYASSGDVDITLRDITATKYRCSGNIEGKDLPVFGTKDWQIDATVNPLNLHYGLDSAILDYGVHGDDEPYFETAEGWMGFGVKQNYTAHTDPSDPYAGGARKQNLHDTDISDLLTGTTSVVVTDEKETYGDLQVSKTVSGSGGDKQREFHFVLTLDNTSIQGQYGDMNFVNGIAEFTLKHGESKIAMKLPSGTIYEVEEIDQGDYALETENARGGIPENGIAKVSFHNHKEKVVTDDPTEENPATYDDSKRLLWMLLVASSAFVSVVMMYRLKRKRS